MNEFSDTHPPAGSTRGGFATTEALVHAYVGMRFPQARPTGLHWRGISCPGCGDEGSVEIGVWASWSCESCGVGGDLFNLEELTLEVTLDQAIATFCQLLTSGHDGMLDTIDAGSPFTSF